MTHLFSYLGPQRARYSGLVPFMAVLFVTLVLTGVLLAFGLTPDFIQTQLLKLNIYQLGVCFLGVTVLFCLLVDGASKRDRSPVLIATPFLFIFGFLLIGM